VASDVRTLNSIGRTYAAPLRQTQGILVHRL